MKKINIAIDGPSGSGKSTLAKNIARELGIIYVDTGALYRAIGLFAIRNSLDTENPHQIKESLEKLCVELVFDNGEQKVFLNGEDVGGLIRTPQVACAASAVSAIPEVRSFLLETQKKLARENSVVMDGRDIGTVILPDADVKLFICADDYERAKRRHEELLLKNENVSVEEIYESMKKRDKNDSQRAIAPAIKAKDAIEIDNTFMKPEETLRAALEIIRGNI